MATDSIKLFVPECCQDYTEGVRRRNRGKFSVFFEYDIEAIEGEDKEKEGHNAFLRLNDGKTPLTSSELIRALYMVKSSGLTDQQRMEISKEWEIIENCLRNDSFWLMFNARQTGITAYRPLYHLPESDWHYRRARFQIHSRQFTRAFRNRLVGSHHWQRDSPYRPVPPL